MDPFLEILGLLVLVGLGAAVGGFFWLRARLRETSAYHQAAAIHKFPQRLRLRRLEPFAWRKLSRGPQRLEAFRTLGLEALAGFAVDEMPNARLLALQHPATGLLGLVNEHPQLGTWSDVLLFVQGESQPILASSILKPAHFHLLPGSPKIHKRQATEQELAAAVLTAAGRGAAPVKLSADQFALRYEEAFAESIDQRLLEPLTDAELRRLVRAQDRPCCEEELTDAEFARIKKQYPAAVANELRLVCAAQFLRETALPASDWQEARRRLLVIHERTPLDQLTRRLVYGAYLTKNMKRHLRRLGRSQSPRESFAAFNATLPPWERYKQLGQVTRPVPADIYRAPIPREVA